MGTLQPVGLAGKVKTMSDITAERYEKNVEKQAPLTTKNRTPVALSAMSLIRRGQLDLVLPDGQRAVYGGKEPGPSAVMHVRDWKVFKRIFSHGDIGLGEDYIRGLWDTQDLKNLMRVAVENIHEHYDLGNDFYKLWLDESMTYSCALFRGDDSKSLREAQQDKYQRILGKLSPAPGETLLEIGCGWGGFMEEAARSGVPVTGVTISEEQAEFARTRLQKAGLSGLTQVRLQDYR